jgi:hypothetical protein
MDAEKSKKLQQYAVALTEQAKQEEKAGKSDEAIKHYLKLVDVFLVLAAEAQDHNTWLQYIRQAEAYQTRTRTLIPKDQQHASVVAAPRNQNTERAEDPQKMESAQKSNPLRKMLKPFQRTEDVTEPRTVIGPQRAPAQQGPGQAAGGASAGAPAEIIPSEVYQRLLSENKILRDKILAVTKENEEQITAHEKAYRELEEKISGMVSRSDYDALQSEFDNYVPKIEYDRVKAELLNSVPKVHYDDLLNRVSEMVPRQVYLDAEKRSMELEEIVKNSIPKRVIEDLVSEVSMLGLLSEVPLDETETNEAQRIEN